MFEICLHTHEKCYEEENTTAEIKEDLYTSNFQLVTYQLNFLMSEVD